MYCPNCGAEFSETEASCPYCGQLNPRGAEKQHMEKLHDLHRSTERLPEETTQELVSGVRRNGRKIAFLMLILLAIVVAGLVLRAVIGHAYDKKRVRSYQDRGAFQEAHFAELDRLFEEGDDARLLEEINALYNQKGSEALYSWEHYAYVSEVQSYTYMQEALEWIRSGDPKDADYASVVYPALSLTRADRNGAYTGRSYTEEELRRLSVYREEAEKVLQETLQWDAAELDAFYDSCLDSYDVLSFKKVEKKVAQRMRELHTVTEGDAS